MRLPEEQIRNIDMPEIRETFADSIGPSSFDGRTLRLEFCVTRMDPPKPGAKPTARRYPSSRMVLTPEAAEDLFARLTQLNEAIKTSQAEKTAPKSTATH